LFGEYAEKLNTENLNRLELGTSQEDRPYPTYIDSRRARLGTRPVGSAAEGAIGGMMEN
jgi:hypothetical protein